jgi:hypothetical protein
MILINLNISGEKFMGLWQDDNRHGNGIIVSLDGIYFEGNFIHGKISVTFCCPFFIMS